MEPAQNDTQNDTRTNDTSRNVADNQPVTKETKKVIDVELDIVIIAFSSTYNL